MNKKYLAKILIICINILLLSLCIWQITRGQYKQHMLDLQKQATSSTDINLQELQNNTSNIKDIIYKHIKVEGKFLDLSFYLYRVYNGSSGYWLVNPFLIKDSNDIILIAHKFIVSPSKNVFLSEQELQKLNDTKYSNNQNKNTNDANINIEISGYILPQLPRVFNLISDKFDVSKKHLMLQNISSQDYDKNYNKDKKYNILNFTLIPLNNKLPDLKQHTMTPDKHYGYAATWLGLFIVSLCFTYSVFRRKKS